MKNLFKYVKYSLFAITLATTAQLSAEIEAFVCHVIKSGEYAKEFTHEFDLDNTARNIKFELLETLGVDYVKDFMICLRSTDKSKVQYDILNRPLNDPTYDLFVVPVGDSKEDPTFGQIREMSGFPETRALDVLIIELSLTPHTQMYAPIIWPKNLKEAGGRQAVDAHLNELNKLAFIRLGGTEEVFGDVPRRKSSAAAEKKDEKKAEKKDDNHSNSLVSDADVAAKKEASATNTSANATTVD